MDQFEEHLEELREAYVRATPRQRLRVALDRVKHPDCGPNRLIQIVSAVEGLARALLVNEAVSTGDSVSHAYDQVRSLNASDLVRRCLGPDPASMFPGETWDTFVVAVKYRNLLIHECTFLGQGRTDKLIASSSEVFELLARMADPDQHDNKPQAGPSDPHK